MTHTPLQPPTIGALGEFALIQRLARRLTARNRAVVCGIGDDCAVLRTGGRRDLLLTCDPVVENVHFLRNTPPRQVGWKAMTRNLSDIAAMGGIPRWAVVSLGLRPNTPVRWVDALYQGLRAAAQRFGCQIVGGDTTHVRHQQFVVVTLLGEVEKTRLTRRAGARVGDAVFVTSALGGSRRGKHLRFIPRVREARWLVEHFPIHAMIDLSDGLSSDLQRLVEANDSRIGFVIDAARVPIAPAARGRLAAALHDGEDFELLFTIAPRHAPALKRRWPAAFDLPLTQIGCVSRAAHPPVRLHHAGDTITPLLPGGYDHFAPRPRR